MWQPLANGISGEGRDDLLGPHDGHDRTVQALGEMAMKEESKDVRSEDEARQSNRSGLVGTGGCHG